MIASLILAAIVSAPAQRFTDLPLASAIAAGVARSPDVAAARAIVRENAALLAGARDTRAPAVTANYALAPQGGNAGTTIEQRLLTLGAQVTLGDYLGYAPLVRQAEAALAQSQFDLLNAERAERIKLVGEYFTALEASAAVRLREQDVRTVQSDLRAAELRFRAGDVPRLDVVRAQVAIANAQSALDSARVAFANADNALSIETGIPLRALHAVSASAAASAAPSDARTAVARAVAQRSDLLAARQGVLAARAAVRLAERGVLPSLTVAAGYTSGVDSGVKVGGPSAAIQLALPISHTAAERAEADRALLDAAAFRVASIQRQIMVDVGAAARSYRASIGATESATRARRAAQQELRATEIGYRNGASSSLDVTDARRTYIQAALAELNAVFAQAQAAAILEQETGP